tara:strand:- start:1813 stop:4005 length:2193 start_codon:yes stop_codon:yes gene_type:complete
MRVSPYVKEKSAKDLVEEISQCVPESVQIKELKDTYPNGRIIGNFFVIGSFKGEEGYSLKIDIRSGKNFMRGNEFNGDQGVGGIVKIMMEGRQMTLPEIKDYFSDYLKAKINKVQEPPISFLNGVKDIKPKYNINTPFDGEHKYLDENNEVLAIIRRYNLKDENNNLIIDNDGKPKKEFRQYIPGSPYPKMPSVRPLYNIPNLLSAEKVIWVEGEKCADALNSIGFTATCHIGGAGMLTKNSEDKYDFSPLQNKEVLVWGDNDPSGKKLADFVKDLALKNGAKSVAVLNIPPDKPEKWDAADAVNEQDFNINDFLNDINTNYERSINLLDDSLLVSRFNDKPPIQKFLVNEIMPLGVPAIFAASGDSGKGMMTMDLAMKISSGLPFQESFGGTISEFGNTIIFTAEDDEDEVHRRISRLDPENKRLDYPHKMRIIPLPNFGGVFPIMQQNKDKSYHTGEQFDKYYQQMLQIDDLKLIVFDPLASFVHADVNADPAAGAALMGLMAKISTETGATVLLCHHMAKVRDTEPPQTPEEARNLIRGTSALVDGVRFAYAVWNVNTTTGQNRASSLDIPYTRNGFFDGAVVKSNGPANREIKHFVRDLNTGLLVDHTKTIQSLRKNNELKKYQVIGDWIKSQEQKGYPLTMRGKNSIKDMIEKRSIHVPKDFWSLRDGDGYKFDAVDSMIDVMKKNERLYGEKIVSTSIGGQNWLGVENGPIQRRRINPQEIIDV